MAHAPILNGSSVSLSSNPGTLPNVSDAMANWFQLLTFTKITKQTVNFKLVETRTDFSFYGVKQPFTAQQLEMKPEGQRTWKWFTVHAYPNLVLVPDEVIFFGTQNFRVMQKLDYLEYGYLEYHIAQDYQA